MVSVVSFFVPFIVLIVTDKTTAENSTASCKVNHHGFYGIRETMYEQHMDSLKYYYQMEYDQAYAKNVTRFHQLQDDLENAFSNAIITSTTIFKECNPNPASSRTPGINATAILTRPRDAVSGKPCPISVTGDSACDVIEGVLSLFYKEKDSASDALKLNSIETEIQAVIRGGMNEHDGSFKNAHEGIHKLHFFTQKYYKKIPYTLVRDDLIVVDADSDEEIDIANKSDRKISIVAVMAILFSTLSILLLVSMFFKFSRRRSPKGDFLVEENVSVSRILVT